MARLVTLHFEAPTRAEELVIYLELLLNNQTRNSDC